MKLSNNPSHVLRKVADFGTSSSNIVAREAGDPGFSDHSQMPARGAADECAHPVPKADLNCRVIEPLASRGYAGDSRIILEELSGDARPPAIFPGAASSHFAATLGSRALPNQIDHCLCLTLQTQSS
jgi:hypothetical protein